MALHDWKLAEDLSVYQIALLSAGYDPSEYANCAPADWDRQTHIDTGAFVSIVKNAVRARKIEWVEEEDSDSFGRVTDWHASLISVESYRQFLKSKNHADKFFNCQQNDTDALTDPFGPFYAPKLAAAIRAVIEVTSDPDALTGKTPKQAIDIWLRKHAEEYGLTNKDGRVNELAIEEICKVANWQPQGGASRTPTTLPKPTYPSEQRSRGESRKPPTPAPSFAAEEEIPF